MPKPADHLGKNPPAVGPFLSCDDGRRARPHRLHFRHDRATIGRQVI